MGSPIPQASFNCGDNPRYGPGKTRLMDPHPFWIQIDGGSAQLTFCTVPLCQLRLGPLRLRCQTDSPEGTEVENASNVPGAIVPRGTTG